MMRPSIEIWQIFSLGLSSETLGSDLIRARRFSRLRVIRAAGNPMSFDSPGRHAQKRLS